MAKFLFNIEKYQHSTGTAQQNTHTTKNQEIWNNDQVYMHTHTHVYKHMLYYIYTYIKTITLTS